jgi:hypothetical protein
MGVLRISARVPSEKEIPKRMSEGSKKVDKVVLPKEGTIGDSTCARIV